MTRICVLTSAHSPYDDRIYHREAVSLKKRGYDVTIIAPYDQSEISPDGIRIQSIPRVKDRARRFLTTGRIIYQAALKSDADLFHFHDPDIIPWMWLLAGRGKKVVYDVHEYTSMTMLTKQWIPRFLRRTLSFWTDLIEKRMSARFSGIITVNHHMESLFRRRNAQVCTVFNYPPPWFVERCFAGDRAHGSRIAYVGSLNKARGYPLIIDAMHLVGQKQPQAVCGIIGPIDYAGIPAEYPRFTAPGETQRNVTWMGSIGFTDVPACLAQSDIGWLPLQSTPNYELAVPVKLIEYMAAGLPVVASRLKTTAGILEQEDCGILVPPADVHAHAQALCDLLADPTRAREMGMRGRAAVLEKYSWSSQEEKMFALYDGILK